MRARAEATDDAGVLYDSPELRDMLAMTLVMDGPPVSRARGGGAGVR